jgi:hypothetical protein
MLFGKRINRNFQYLTKKGYKMTKLHISQSAGSGTPSGIKVCIFGGNSNIATAIGGLLVTRGCPTVFVHRNALDPIMPDGLDSHSSKNNPYYTLVHF